MPGIRVDINNYFADIGNNNNNYFHIGCIQYITINTKYILIIPIYIEWPHLGCTFIPPQPPWLPVVPRVFSLTAGAAVSGAFFLLRPMRSRERQNFDYHSQLPSNYATNIANILPKKHVCQSSPLCHPNINNNNNNAQTFDIGLANIN